MLIILVAAALIILGLTALLNSYNYSIGSRTGILDKLSQKGIMCWTMEGQLALPAFSKPGTLRSSNENIDNTFYFSVPDHEIKKKLEAIPPGSPMTVDYHQKLFALAWPIPFLLHREVVWVI